MVRKVLPWIVGLGVVALLEPSLLTGTIRSPRALAVVALTVVAVVVIGRLAGARWGSRGALAARIGVLAIAGWFLVLPAVRMKTIVEDLPVAAGAPATSVQADTPTEAPAQEPSAQEPVRITTGRFEGIGHEASGAVSVFRLGDGSHIVRFDDIEIRGSPDPVLYVVPGRDGRSREGGTEIAPLRATKGSFNQSLPAGVDLEGDFTIFIWCRQFATPIARAGQTPA